MIQNGHIHQGYKFSPLGIIPQEWEVKQICDVGKVITGSTPPTNDESCFGSEYMFVTPADIVDTKYIVDTERKLSTKGFSASRKMPKGCILFTCIGSTIGKMAIAATELTSNQQINAIICNDIDNDFLFYRLSYQQNRIRLLAGEQAVPIINKSDFERIKIAVPPIEEQKKIAELLSEWDKAIELQKKLIEKQELRKRALMQHLLTGRVRLNGFSDKWKNVSLGEVLTTLTNGFIYKGNGNGEMPISRIETISTGSINYNKVGYVKYSEQIETYRLNTGDILYSHINSLSHIGKVAYYDGKQPLYHGMNLLRIVVDEKKCNQKYLYYYLTSKRARHKARTIAKPAINQASISISDLSTIKLILPDVSEQTAIAEVLISVDKEIEIAKTKLSSLCNQKRGLMQQLLTGKKRIL